MRQIEFRLTDDILSRDGGEPRRLNDADWQRFDQWIARYHAIAPLPSNDAALRELGHEIAAWLDGPDGWVTSLRDSPTGEVVPSFAVQARLSENDRRFLEVPWELAAQDGEFLAKSAAIMWAPLRRIGATLPPLPPDHDHKLGVMFMAAAPRGENRLDFEAEEASILQATADTPMDLIVEDEGTLAGLRTAWNDAKSLDALHLSCHGLGGKEPFLALEDEYGELQRASLADLAGHFVIRRPRLLFLSACHTGESLPEVDSLSLGLVQAGFSTVLGWADAVRDSDASRFAAAFYAHAAQTGATIQSAWAGARFALIAERRPPAHWHLARLFLGPNGGGPLARGATQRVTTDQDAGRKGILNARGKGIEVASRFEFVGRREQVQEIRRAFRRHDNAGVLLHGAGRQGKSSLAARIIDRHPHLTEVVLFQACDGLSVLGAMREQLKGDGAKEADTAYDAYRAHITQADPPRDDPVALFRALRDLLTGACGTGRQPILLVLDDFEALLDPPSGAGHWRVKPAAEVGFASIIRAFDSAAGPSRLLITCRYDFPFEFGGRDLGARLLKVPLPPMSRADTLKQAARKLRAAEAGRFATSGSEFARHIEAAIKAARDNTGLRDMLFQAVLADAGAGAAVIRSLETYFASRGPIDNDVLRATVEGLIVGQLLAMLTEPEMQLLRASTLFALPLPLAVWDRYAARAGVGPADRLLRFGLWDRFPDLVDPRQSAAAINAIAATRVERPAL